MFPSQCIWIISFELKGPRASRVDVEIISTRLQSHVLELRRCQYVLSQCVLVSVLLDHRVRLSISSGA